MFTLLSACLEASGVRDGGHTADCSLLAVFAAVALFFPLGTTRCRCGPGFRVTEAAASLSGCWDLHRLDLIERNSQFDYFSLQGDNAILHVSHFGLVKFLLARQARIAFTLALKFLQGHTSTVSQRTWTPVPQMAQLTPDAGGLFFFSFRHCVRYNHSPLGSYTQLV